METSRYGQLRRLIRRNGSSLFVVLIIAMVLVGYGVYRYIVFIEEAKFTAREQLLDRTRAGGRKLERAYRVFSQNLKYIISTNNFSNLLYRKTPYPPEFKVNLRRFYARHQDLIDEIRVYGPEGNFKTIQKDAANYYTISELQQGSPAHKCPGTWRQGQKYYRVDLIEASAGSEPLVVVTAMNSTRFIKSVLSAFYLGTKAWIILVDEEIQPVGIISGRRCPPGTGINLSASCIENISNRYEGLTDHEILLDGGSVNVVSAYYPLDLYDRPIGIIFSVDRAALFGALFSTNLTLFGIFVCTGLLFVTAFMIVLKNRQLAHKALQESEKRYRVTFQSSPDAITLRSVEDGRYLHVNDAFCCATGYSQEEIIGRTPFSLDLIASQADWDKCASMLKENGEVNGFEIQYRTRDSAILDMVFSARQLQYGKRICLVEIAKDVTTIKQIEQDKAKLQVQLYHSQKMEAFGTLAGGIAHDFNNILAAMIGYIELAKLDLPENSSAQPKLDEVFRAGIRAKDLVQQILTFSRRGKQQRTEAQMGLIVQEALKLIRALLPTTIEIRQNIKSESDTVFADPTQIHQIVMNLCTNAAHAMMEKGGVLEVRLEDVILDSDTAGTYPELRPGPHVRLTLKDTGRGMAPEVLDRIFDPYFTTKAPGEGTGLGLAVVHGIVKSHGGAITVDSTPGKGTTFHVLFPTIEKHQAEAADTFEPLPGGSEHILVVDDEKALADIMKQTLERLGYSVVVKISSFEALEAFRMQPNKFDMVITDQTMPNMTGEMLAGEIMCIRSDIPIILCTGFSKQITEDQAKMIGISEYLIKPLVARELAASVRKALDKN